MVKIDNEACIGCGACEAACPKMFKVVDGKAKLTGKKDKCLKEAIEVCPVQAITD